jgi:hypothetical protein
MYTIVETFRRRANAERLAAALSKAGIRCRVRSQGDGAIWNVFVQSHDTESAHALSLATIYI